MTDMDIDSLCDTMTNTSVKYDVNAKLVKDLDIIINDIIESGTFDRDIYDICVNCGHALTWDQEYIIYQADIDWLKKMVFTIFSALYMIANLLILKLTIIKFGIYLNHYMISFVFR